MVAGVGTNRRIMETGFTMNPQESSEIVEIGILEVQGQ